METELNHLPPSIDPSSPWAILRVKDNFFSVPCQSIQAIIALNQVKPIPNLPKHIRGVMNHRDQIIHLIDMRVMLSLRSLYSEVHEFIELMITREQDHIAWLDALENSVKEEKSFSLVTDPRQCKFGQWYYEFLPTVKDIALQSLLKSFEKPHNNIHGIAIHVEHLLSEGKKMEALALIDEKKNCELKKMIELFSEVKRAYHSHHREIVIVLEYENRQSGLIVDQVISITNLSWDNWRSMKEILIDPAGSNYMMGVAEIPENNLPVVILDIPLLCT